MKRMLYRCRRRAQNGDLFKGRISWEAEAHFDIDEVEEMKNELQTIAEDLADWQGDDARAGACTRSDPVIGSGCAPGTN